MTIKYYAVKKGRTQGIFMTWDECKNSISKYSGAEYKSFKTHAEAYKYLNNPDHNSGQFNKTYKKKNITTNKIKLSEPNINVVNQINDISLQYFKPLNNYYYIFTDGSHQKSHTSYGVYIPGMINQFANIITDENGKTNNIAELHAIHSALLILLNNHNAIIYPEQFNIIGNPKIKHGDKIYIISDSQYSIKCVTLWYKKWEQNNWLTANKTPVANKDIIINIINLLQKLKDLGYKIEFMHQYAHNSPPTKSKESIEYYLWHGNYIVDHLVQKKVIDK